MNTNINAALREAVDNNDAVAVREALENGADAKMIIRNEQKNFYIEEIPILNYAVIHRCSIGIAELLLRYGADIYECVRIHEINSETKEIRLSVFPILIDAIEQLADDEDKPAEPEMVRFLIEHGADVNAFVISGTLDRESKQYRYMKPIISVIGSAVMNGADKEIVDLLLQHGADPDKAFPADTGAKT